MKKLLYISFVLLFVFFETNPAQTYTFSENKKWGVKEKGALVIPPVYDTVFNFDPTGRVCMACFKIKTASANKFIKVFSTAYSCNYLNKNNERLKIKTEGNDTCSIFSFGKTSLKLYNQNSSSFVVSVKGKKNLVNKDFRQMTFKGYYDISESPAPDLYITQFMSEGDVIYTGLINSAEQEIIPYRYSQIRINPLDSLILACSAGVRNNGTDDVYDYKGDKTGSYLRHVELATKNFIVHKLFEPEEYYIIYDIETKEEKNLHADEIRLSEHDEIGIRINNDWYLYDLRTSQKKPTNTNLR